MESKVTSKTVRNKDDHEIMSRELVPYLLQRASYLATQEFYRKLQLNDISRNCWRMLAWLSENQPYSALELTDRLMIAQPSVTQLVNNATKDGLICKTIDPKDKRRVQIVLTKKGEQLVTKLKKKAAVCRDHLTHILTPELSERLADVLKEAILRLEDA